MRGFTKWPKRLSPLAKNRDLSREGGDKIRDFLGYCTTVTRPRHLDLPVVPSQNTIVRSDSVI